MPSPPLALPVETVSRELPGKCWLAMHLLEDFDVYLGKKAELVRNLDLYDPAVFVHKDGYNPGLFDRLTEAGSRICVIETENASDSDIALDDANEAVIRAAELYVAWGKLQYQRYKQADPAVVKAMGNPRFDIYNPEVAPIFADRAARLNQEHGPFVLVNTNFLADQKRKHTRLTRNAEWHYSAAMSKVFQELAIVLDTEIDEHVIIRPHPAAHLPTWKAATEGCDSVSVIREDTVAVWILAAEAVIHNSCTTGIESAWLGTPTIAYQPILSERFDNEFYNRFSTRCQTPEAVVEATTERQSPPPLDADGIRERFSNYHANAAPQLAAELAALAPQDVSFERANNPDRIARALLRSQFKPQFERIYAAVTHHEKDRWDQKFPPDIEDEVRYWCAQVDALDLGLPTPAIERCAFARDVYRITAAA
jgi:surface carbohydrate biosynthesis protein